MDERVEKAFEIANYMSTLSNQRRVALEELEQKLVHYTNGGTFKITPTLINFTKTVLDLGHDSDMAFIDENNLPILINDVQKFFDTIVEIYFQAVNEYASKYAEIKSKRKVEDIVKL